MADFEISLWADIFDAGYKENREIITIPELFRIIRGEKYKVIIEKIRSVDDKAKRDELKQMLPAVTVSGTFRERRIHGLIKHSGFICMDFDNLGAKAESIKTALQNDKNIYGCFTSASGRGLAVLVRIDSHRHTETFTALERYFYEQYGLVADVGCKDICRLRYFSHDPSAYTNTASQIYNKFPKVDTKPKKHYVAVLSTKSDIGKIVSQATQKGMDITDGSYAEWQRLAASLATLGEQGRDYFHALSQYNSKYDHTQADKKFDNMLNSANGNITIGTFYYYAKRSGLDTNTEKASKVLETCREVKRIKNLTVDNAIKRLQDKSIICIDEDEKSNTEDIELVKKVYETTDVSEIAGIQEIENYIFENYEFRRNEISNQIEWKTGEELEDKDFNEIYIETKKQYPKINKSDICSIIDAKTETYNPLKDYIEEHRSLITEGKTANLINEIAATITTASLNADIFDAEYEEYFIRKWFVGMIATIYGHTSPLLLALCGEIQNTGKSEFFKRLLPRKLYKYFADMKIGIDKDAQIAMTRYLVIFDDELAGKSKMEEEHLKALTSKSVFTFRPPYGTTSIQRRRLAVLCGTTNDKAILGDPTGNRRVIPISVMSINHANYNSIDKDALFMEAVRLYEAGEKWELTTNDIDRLAKNTTENIKENFEKDLILKFFTRTDGEASESFAGSYTPTDIILILEKETSQKLNVKKIGSELRNLGFKKTQRRIGGGRQWVYLANQIKVAY